ncbi:dihydrofolate reductase family protein [Micromonospora aurantiaca (nom. illeg.)]|uniref:dihydrofolate reductase family protein n=1 Tax=Micromonospora aurantiaca (nom. illeg.) TaxID=47850 RepID=UPI0033A399A3
MSTSEARGRVRAFVTVSLDGYVTGPDDHAGQGLGVGGERLHHWVMGGPWTYDTPREPGTGMTGEDRAYFDELLAGVGAALCGRGMYDAAGAWGGRNPFEAPLVVLTHRTADQPDPDAGFLMVDGFDAALAAARRTAGDGAVVIGGGADVIRQALAAGVVDELGLSTAPVILGRGKRLFEGFDRDVDLEIRAVHHSRYAVHVRYAVGRPARGTD